MIVDTLIPRGYKPAEPLTPEDREIIRVKRAGVTVLMDRQDATDMLLYAQLRRQQMPKDALSIGISSIVGKLDAQLMEQIHRHIEGLAGEAPRPTLQ